jgi:hypothetical protein
MKTLSKFKITWVIAAIFSLSAFLFVNVHAGFFVQKPQINQVFDQTQLEEVAQAEDGKLTVPDVTVLGSLLEIAQKLITQQH